MKAKNKSGKKHREVDQITATKSIGGNADLIKEIKLEGIMGAIMRGCEGSGQTNLLQASDTTAVFLSQDNTTIQ